MLSTISTSHALNGALLVLTKALIWQTVPVQAAMKPTSPSPGGGGGGGCFQTFEYTNCDVTMGRSSPMDEYGIKYAGERVHLTHPDSGQCFDGFMTGTPGGYYLDQINTARPYACIGANGPNQYCAGPCAGGPFVCYEPRDYLAGDFNFVPVPCIEDIDPVTGFPAALLVEGFCENIGNLNNLITFTNSAAQCFDAYCGPTGFGVAYVIPNTTCFDLQGLLTYCYGGNCSRQGGRRRKRALASAEGPSATTALSATTTMEPGDELYKEYSQKCGQVEYDVSLFVNDHFYAIASPKDAHSSCPVITAEANYQDENAYYDKVIKAVDEKDAEYFVGAQADSLSIGTFQLDELRHAVESIDPTKSTKKAYDVIANNCAEFMLSLASALDVKIDTKITSYVTRRLIQESGKDLLQKIRSSVNFDSLLHGFGADRNLRAADVELQPSDKQVIQALVESRAAKHLSQYS